MDGAPPSAATLALAVPAPNPFRESTRLAYTLAATVPVEVEIDDVLGRRVVPLSRGVLGAGPHVLDWDGRDASGRAAGAGLYFARVRAGGESATARLMRLR